MTDYTLKVNGMDCGNCAATVEKGVGKLPGVESANVTLSTETLTVSGSVGLAAIQQRVEQLGYTVEKEGVPPPDLPQTNNVVAYLLSRRDTAAPLILAALLALSLPLSFMTLPPWAQILVTGLHLVAVVVAGIPIMLKGLRALFLARNITIDLLMTIATIGAVAIGETGEAATVVVLFAIGEALESYSADRARASLGSLLELAPQQAIKIEGDNERIIPVEQVQPGDTLLVRPGDRVPVDATIIEGHSSLDERAITGESMPVERGEGDEVFAGTVNAEGALLIKATRPAADSTLSRIVKLVEQAQSQKAPIERWIDRFATWYTPAVVVFATLIAVVPPLVFGAPFLGEGGWLYRGLTLLIVACPCALVISTPVTVVSAISGLARRGVLVKGGAYLEALSRVTTIAFDKTGTLTEGRPRVLRTRTPQCDEPYATCPACDDMLAYAAAVERRSEHPLAAAITSEASQRGVERRYPVAADVTALRGAGVAGTVAEQPVRVGKHGLFHEGECDTLCDPIKAAEQQGETVVLVERGGDILGYLTLEDTPREASQRALAALKEAYPDLRMLMLTGDNATTAQKVAEAVGHIDEVRAGLLPEEKLDAIRAVPNVAMVGDGINDAPALAAADVGIAMGGAGTAQAMQTADVVLMNDDLARLPDAIATSHRAHRVIRANIGLALALKAAILALTLFGFASLWLAVVADVGSTLIVTANGMRLLRGAG